MDSYQKFAMDELGPKESGLFQHVKKEDLDEVWVRFALAVNGVMYADNFRVFPLDMRKKYDELRRRGCCGFWDTEYKCVSGNVYLMGCNYGH